MAQQPMEELDVEDTARLFLKYLVEEKSELLQGDTVQREAMRALYTKKYKPNYKDEHPGKTLANFAVIIRVSS